MKVVVRQVPAEEKPLLFRLMQLYMYDFSGIEGFDIGADALFEYKGLDSYWSDPTRYPFLIYVNTHIAGFVLVNSYTCVPDIGEAKSIAEFFVLRKYRRQGIGRAAACQVFDRFPGRWEVRQIPRNIAGREFWRSVIHDYTAGAYKEVDLDNEFWKGPAQIFDSRRAERSSS